MSYLFRPLAIYLRMLSYSVGISFFYRFLFFLYHRESFFSGLTEDQVFYALVYGLRFDLCLASYIAMLAMLLSLLFPKNHKTKLAPLFCMLLLLQSSVLISDLMYFTESARHLSYEIKEAAGSSAWSLFLSAWTSHSWILMLSIAFQMFFSFHFLKRCTKKTHPLWDRTKALQVLTAIVLFIPMARGGFQMVPIKPEFAYQAGNSKMANLSLNGAYSGFYEIVNPRSLVPQFVPPQDPQASLDLIPTLYKDLDTTQKDEFSTPIKRNLVVVLLEGWSAVDMSSYGAKLPTTPFFSKLLEKSFSAQAMLAGGRRTTEGIFNIFCSYPNPLGRSVAQTQLQNFHYLCTPQILHRWGWSTAFFQGSLKETSSTGSFAQSLGFELSYGRDDIPYQSRGRNSWGAHDDDLFEFVLERAKNLPQPFLLGVNTNSTHDHEIPKNFQAPFSGDDIYTQRMNVLNYADEALYRFVEKFEQDFPDTVFVFVADHTSFTNSSLFDQFHIPFAIYGKEIPVQTFPSIVSQRDISPSLLDLLKIPQNEYQHFTGNSLFSSRYSFADVFHNGEYGWAKKLDFYLYHYKEKAYGSLYSWQEATQKLSEISSPETELHLHQESLEFIQKTQDLLFKGETSSFRKTK